MDQEHMRIGVQRTLEMLKECEKQLEGYEAKELFAATNDEDKLKAMRVRAVVHTTSRILVELGKEMALRVNATGIALGGPDEETMTKAMRAALFGLPM